MNGRVAGGEWRGSRSEWSVSGGGMNTSLSTKSCLLAIETLEDYFIKKTGRQRDRASAA